MLVNLQNEFLEFHDKIKLDDENAVLREKREILLKKLRTKISSKAASFESFNQGSYAMHTGIKPENGDYDIDVGLIFDIDKNEYDPITPKKWVRDALIGHTKKVEIRRSCVTVEYQKDNDPVYHVDFAVYGKEKGSRLFIAKGKECSTPENKFWEESDPKGLIKLVRDKFSGDDAAQFRRCIRYLKKWKDRNFSITGNSSPSGIGLTILAYDNFSVRKDVNKVGVNVYDDFNAMLNLLNVIKYEFLWDGCYHYIICKLPVSPYNNIFEKMTKLQQEQFYKKICDAISVFEAVKTERSKNTACQKLAALFGEEFPIKSDRSIVGTSESA